jgi:glycosyltransferase involved in cell wall biosynthesis
MNIVMMTNTYLPHTGGVARSVAWFTESFRGRGHRVLVVAPTFEGQSGDEPDVVRVPAVQNFNGSDFSVRLPVPGILTARLDAFEPELVHSHHPFLMGQTALRAAASRNLPVVFTHHTMYERYIHYTPADSEAMARFAIRLATEYANLCDHVIAPSDSIAEILRDRGVTVPITAIPTGIDRERFASGDGSAARRRYDIADDAFVVGHVGRLAPEKNLAFLAEAVAAFLRSNPAARFLLVGYGPSVDEVERIFRERGVADRLHHPGALDGRPLADAYHAADVFAFASKTETQGMVLAEAMTAGVPVVALDAAGVREVVRDGENGRLLSEEDAEAFAAALSVIAASDEPARERMRRAALETAKEFAMPRCAERVIALYEDVLRAGPSMRPSDDAGWAATVRLIEEEWNAWSGIGRAAGEALLGSAAEEAREGN